MSIRICNWLIGNCRDEPLRRAVSFHEIVHEVHNKIYRKKVNNMHTKLITAPMSCPLNNSSLLCSVCRFSIISSIVTKHEHNRLEYTCSYIHNRLL